MAENTASESFATTLSFLLTDAAPEAALAGLAVPSSAIGHVASYATAMAPDAYRSPWATEYISASPVTSYGAVADTLSVPLVDAYGKTYQSFASTYAAVQDFVSLWSADGKAIGDRTLQAWIAEAVPRHELTVSSNFDSFISGLSTITARRPDAHESGVWADVVRLSGPLSFSTGDIFTWSGHTPLATVRRRRLSASRLRRLWRGFARWVNQAQGDASRDVAIKQLLRIVRARCSRRAHRVLVQRSASASFSAGARVRRFEFRVGNPPPAGAHAIALSGPIRSLHVTHPEAAHEQILRFTYPAGFRDGLCSRSPYPRRTPRSMAMSPAPGHEGVARRHLHLNATQIG